MVNINIILLIITIIFFLILISRYFEIIPSLLTQFMIRNQTFENLTPQDLGLNAVNVSIPLSEAETQGWFFPGPEEQDAVILMVPSWVEADNFSKYFRTANLLQKIGFNVLIPLYYKMDANNTQSIKLNTSTKYLNHVIEKTYEFLITYPGINRRKIGIYTNSFGSTFACSLVYDYPIKSIVIEDGPISFNDMFTVNAFGKNKALYFIFRVFFGFFTFPFFWLTKWQSNHSLRKIRATPSFLIASRENQLQPHKSVWKSYQRLYKPKQFWFEHSILPNTIKDVWKEEYLQKIKHFYDRNLAGLIQPEFHFDFVGGRKDKGKYPNEITITVMPPQLAEIPLQILLADNSNLEELRIYFTGASKTIPISLDFKPKYMTLLPFYAVDKTELSSFKQWKKRGLEFGLLATIDELLRQPLSQLNPLLNRYYYLKSILLFEQGEKNLAKQILITKIDDDYWKQKCLNDSDSRQILDKSNTLF
ncbi:hypothetical protein [Candidatus Hodarchaeum mangrovi]